MAERLTPEAEKDLALLIREGDEPALHRLVASNLAFVAGVARAYRGYGVPFQDLLGEGNLGLIEAARRFDPARGTRFTTCAVWWIRKAILRALSRQSAMVRVPEQRRGEPGAVRKRRIEVVSISEPAGRTEVPLADTLADRLRPDPEARLLSREARHIVIAAVWTLSPRERAILGARFGLEGEEVLPLRDMGDRLGLSGETVRQIEKRALKKIRRLLVRRELRRGHPAWPGPAAASVTPFRPVTADAVSTRTRRGLRADRAHRRRPVQAAGG